MSHRQRRAVARIEAAVRSLPDDELGFAHLCELLTNELAAVTAQLERTNEYLDAAHKRIRAQGGF